MNKPLDVLQYSSVSSTQDTASTLLSEQNYQSHNFAVMSSSQTNGRGRSGGNWSSPSGGNLYVTYAIELHDTDNLSFLGYRACLAIIRVLASHLAISHSTQFRIKWPNDIFVSSGKCAGILVDVLNQNRWSLIGFGCNFAHAPTGASVITLMDGKNLEDVVMAWYECFTYLQHQDDAAVISEINNHLAFKDSVVQLKQGQQVICGKLIGISRSGGLVIEKSDGTIKQLFSGNIQPGSFHAVSS